MSKKVFRIRFYLQSGEILEWIKVKDTRFKAIESCCTWYFRSAFEAPIIKSEVEEIGEC